MARVITTRETGDTQQVAASFLSFLARSVNGDAPVIITVFASTQQPLGELLGPLQEAYPEAACVGSSTAGEFTEEGDSKGGAVLWAVMGDDLKAAAGMGVGLKQDPTAALTAAIPDMPEDPARPHRTAILLLDPLAGNGEEAALLASSLLGPSVRLAGGAAGDDLHFEHAVVGAGDKAAADAVVVVTIASAKPLGIGVEHGHRPISAPMTVTRAQGAVVHELEGKPAFEVWRDAVREHAADQGLDIDSIEPENMGSHLLRYEVGLIAGPNEFKIRAPLAVNEDGSLNFACGLPEGAVVRVTESGGDNQVASARAAAERARSSMGNGKVAGALVFDCICRNLILGDRFSDAVDEVGSALGDVPLAGFETYGEIAMDIGQMSGFHNTTTVVLAFPE